jgi:hypothetical protein
MGMKKLGGCFFFLIRCIYSESTTQSISRYHLKLIVMMSAISILQLSSIITLILTKPMGYDLLNEKLPRLMR